MRCVLLGSFKPDQIFSDEILYTIVEKKEIKWADKPNLIRKQLTDEVDTFLLPKIKDGVMAILLTEITPLMFVAFQHLSYSFYRFKYKIHVKMVVKTKKGYGLYEVL